MGASSVEAVMENREPGSHWWNSVRPDERGGIEAGEAPGPAEIIFSARAVDSRLGLSVDPDHLVALIPAAPLVLEDRQRHSDEVAVPGGLQEDVVVRPRDVAPARIAAGFAEIVAVEVGPLYQQPGGARLCRYWAWK